MFERRHVDLGQQSLRRDKGQSGGAPVPSLLAAGKPVHVAAADVARLQRAVGNRGIAALLTQQPDASIPPIQIQRCGEPGCDCVEDRTAPDLEVQRNGDAATRLWYGRTSCGGSADNADWNRRSLRHSG